MRTKSRTERTQLCLYAEHGDIDDMHRILDRFASRGSSLNIIASAALKLGIRVLQDDPGRAIALMSHHPRGHLLKLREGESDPSDSGTNGVEPK